MTALALILLLFSADKIDYNTAHLDRRIAAIKITERLNIDGRMEESGWDTAPIAKNFIQTEPKEGDLASESTEVRVLYDADYLYFGVTAHDSHANGIVIADLKKDFSSADGDGFEIILDTFHDRRNGYQFAVNAAGAKWDAQMINEGREVNANWDAVWYVKTHIEKDGWTAEIAIPFKTLKFLDSDVQTWGMNFHRILRSNVRNEDSYWSPLPRIYNIQRTSLAGTLEGLENIRPGSNIRFKPFVTSSYSQNRQIHKNDGKADAGFDVKYGITSGLTWDFTYRTDFSQVEADEQQINLTRFSLLFPEKRDFFLENSGIFQFGVPNMGGGPGGGGGTAGRLNAISSDMIFFFSRNIGIGVSATGSSGDVIPIVGGTRLTGRTGRFELGFLNMQQKALGTNHAVNFTVGRLRRNILKNSDIGVMMTSKEVMDSPQSNRVIGSDANFRFGSYTTANGYIARSFTPNQQNHTLAGRGQVGYQDLNWGIRGSFTNIEQNFNDEMGFAPRLGVRRTLLFAGRTIRLARWRRFLRQMMPHTQLDYILNKDGKLDTRYIDYHLPLNFQNGSFIEIGANPSLELLSKPFDINKTATRTVTIPAGRYTFNEWFFTGYTDRSRPISGSARIASGDFYTGFKHSYTVGVTWRANYRLNTSFSYTKNNVDLPQGSFDTNLLSTRVNYSFSTKMFLNALIQYNSDTRQWSSNVRFNIIHRPLSDFFIVYNDRRDDLTHSLIDRALIAKVTYMMSK